jgi:hypothetical protein
MNSPLVIVELVVFNQKATENALPVGGNKALLDVAAPNVLEDHSRHWFIFPIEPMLPETEGVKFVDPIESLNPVAVSNR